MDMEHMHHLLAEHHHAPILIIGDVPHVPFVKKPDFEHMLADKLGKEIQEIAKASAYYLFDDEALRHTKEQQKLRNRHYRGRMNSPKK